ncbi:MAG: PrsW family glutamic-type intramembrane protease [bacterium]
MLWTSLALIATVLFSAGLAAYLLSHDDGPNEPIWALLVVFVIGLAAAQLSGVINQKLIPFAVDSSVGFMGAVVIGIVPGVFEELLKVLPVAFFVSSQAFFRRATDGVIYFAFTGLAFGLLENIQYILISGAAVGFDRLLTLLFFHAATSGIFGYYYWKAKASGDWRSLVVPASLLIGAHALYNFSAAYSATVPPFKFVAYTISIGLSVQLIRTYGKARRNQ